MSGLLKAINSAAEAASPGLGAASVIGGFFTSIGARRRRRREMRRRRKRARKSEGLLLGAAGNVVQDNQQQGEFLQEGFNIGQQQAVTGYKEGMQNITDTAARAGVAGLGVISQSATYLQDQFQLGQQQASLGMRSEQYQLEQQKESRLRDIQSNLLELSAYSGRNINVLEMYDIS